MHNYVTAFDKKIWEMIFGMCFLLGNVGLKMSAFGECRIKNECDREVIMK